MFLLTPTIIPYGETGCMQKGNRPKKYILRGGGGKTLVRLENVGLCQENIVNILKTFFRFFFVWLSARLKYKR